MAYERQLISIPFDVGLDAGTEPLVAAGLSLAENAVYPRRGAIAKRPGQTRGAPTISGTRKLAELADSAMLIGDGPLQRYDAAADRLLTIESETTRTLDIETRSRLALANRANPVRQVEFGEGTDFFAIAVYRYHMSLVLWVYDTATGVQLAQHTLATSAVNFLGCRLVSIGGSLRVYYADGSGNLLGDSVSRSGVSGAPETITDNYKDHASQLQFDACAVGSQVFVVFKADTGGLLTLIRLPSGLISGAATHAEPGTSAANGTIGCYAIDADEGMLLWVENDVGGGWNCFCSAWSTAGSNTLAPAAFYEPSDDDYDAPIAITGIGRNYAGTNGTAYVCLPEPATTPSQNPAYWIHEQEITGGGSNHYPGKLATKPGPIGTAEWILGLFVESWGSEETAATIVGDNTQGSILWAATSTSKLRLCGVSALGRAVDLDVTTPLTSALSCALPYLAVGVRTEDTTEEATVGIATHTVDPQARPIHLEHDRALYIGGALPLYCDGVEAFEQGFVLWPHPIHVATSGTGTNHPEGDYYFALIYAYTDALGRTHRSAPTPSYFHLAVGASGASAFVIYAPIPPTLRGELDIEVYRTEPDGTTLYRSWTYHAYSAAWPTTARFVSFNDEGPTSAAINAEAPIYTDGNVLRAEPMLPYRRATIWQGRLITLHREAENTDVRFSRRIAPNEPFIPSAQRLPFDARARDIRALAVLGDRMVAFTEDECWAIQGELPNDLGREQSLSEWYQLSPSIGCVNPDTIVRVPQGLMFLAQDGLWILTGSMQLQPVGDAIRWHSDHYTIVSGHLRPEEHQAVWITSDGPAIVYDWLRDRWSTWTNHASSTAAIVSGRLVRLESGRLWQTDTTNYADNAAHYGLRVATHWIQLAGVAGYGRLFELLVLGYYLESAKLLVEVGLNGDPAWRELLPFDLTTLASFSADAYYGEGLDLTTYDSKAMALRLRPPRSRALAFRVRLTEQRHTPADTQGVELVGLGAVVGIAQRQLFKAGQPRQIVG